MRAVLAMIDAGTVGPRRAVPVTVPADGRIAPVTRREGPRRGTECDPAARRPRDRQRTAGPVRLNAAPCSKARDVVPPPPPLSNRCRSMCVSCRNRRRLAT